MHRVFLFLFVVLSPLGAMALEQDRLAIEATDGGYHAFEVELAVRREDKAVGLMFREHLAPDAGMLFLYERPQNVRMWMKNTLIPLDMLFIAADGLVVKVARETEPHSLEIIEAGQPVTAVLELAGGTAERLGITPGAVVLHPAFGTGE